MTIKEMADAYIGYPQEIDEGSCTFGKRLAYERGARDMIDKAHDWLFERVFNEEDVKLDAFKKAMEE